MKNRTASIFVSIGVLAAILGAASYAINKPVRRWVAFYAWKVVAGKAHGGRYLSVNNVRIYYETYGAGPPVLVLHGGLGSIEGMSYQIMALAASRFCGSGG
jgi:hypothetical protein